jgi:hypothetical protein
MKQPEHAPRSSDRISTREELFEVLEMLGGLEEPRDSEQDSEMESACNLFLCLDTDPTIMAGDYLETDTSNEERLLMEIEPFASLRGAKAERIN